MRLLATLVLLLAAILAAGGVEITDTKDASNNTFYYDNGPVPNIEAYAKLLEDLRSRLTGETDPNGIAVTRPETNIPLKDRFLQVQLKNSGGEVITVIINTVNVNVVGYLDGPAVNQTLHYLNDNQEALDLLFQAFPGIKYSSLGFAGNYDSLPDRASHQLGHESLNDAIRGLLYGQDQKMEVLVIVQMVSEAVRIRYIEHLIIRHMIVYRNFYPDPMVISMEDEWSALSKQIQWSGDSGVFLTPIEVRSVSNDTVQIRNVVEAMRQAALALMLYQCNNNPLSGIIRMPVPVAVAGSDEQCPSGEPTTNIIGRDGLCMDMPLLSLSDNVILRKCGNAQTNQLWTFKSDGTIRSSNGKCLITGFSPGAYITVFECDKIVPEDIKWVLYDAGTIMNPKSGLVIAAESSTEATMLTVAEHNNSSMQAWSAGNYTRPTINYISGFRETCLHSYGFNAIVSLENCVINGTEPSQQWAFYGDNTIRLYSNQTLCVTSNIKDYIVLDKCQGRGDQRWTFMANGTILNPNARLVMDVDVEGYIILNKPAGSPSQKWVAF